MSQKTPSILDSIKTVVGSAYQCGHNDAPSFCVPEYQKVYGVTELIAQLDANDADYGKAIQLNAELNHNVTELMAQVEALTIKSSGVDSFIDRLMDISSKVNYYRVRSSEVIQTTKTAIRKAFRATHSKKGRKK